MKNDYLFLIKWRNQESVAIYSKKIIVKGKNEKEARNKARTLFIKYGKGELVSIEKLRYRNDNFVENFFLLVGITFISLALILDDFDYGIFGILLCIPLKIYTSMSSYFDRRRFK